MNMIELLELLEIMFEKEIQAYRLKNGIEIDEELDLSELAEILYDECDVNLDQLELIIERLLPLCQLAKSELTGTVYRGFGKDNMWIIKRKV